VDAGLDAKWIAIIVTVTLAIIGGLVAHILHDAKAHERIATVESKVGMLEKEQERTRDGLHKLRDDLPQKVKDLVAWFTKSG